MSRDATTSSASLNYFSYLDNCLDINSPEWLKCQKPENNFASFGPFGRCKYPQTTTTPSTTTLIISNKTRSDFLV